jgi:hypothetical protein
MNAQAISLDAPYSRVAVYYDLSDTVEYLRGDESCVYRRIDARLTLALNMDSGEVIGFRLKGFKNFYLRELKPVCDKLGIEFVELAQAFAKAVEEIGDDVVDEERIKAYRAAYEIAHNDNVKLMDLSLAA